MGYRIEYKRVTVRFAEDHEFYGLEAVFEGMDIETYLRITGMDGVDEGEGVGGSLVRASKALVSWNMEDSNGRQVPASAENFMRLPHHLGIALGKGWLDGLAGVSDTSPLGESLTSGQPSRVEELPMEALSPSLAS